MSQRRNCGENTFPSVTKASTAATELSTRSRFRTSRLRTNVIQISASTVSSAITVAVAARLALVPPKPAEECEKTMPTGVEISWCAARSAAAAELSSCSGRKA